MPFLACDRLNFHYHSDETGLPLVMLHGLGGDANQPRGLLAGMPGIRLITIDFRGHGETFPLGPEEKISIAQFAEDVRAIFDQLALERAVLGGVSLGAAVALRFALAYGSKVRALILSRPAWLAGPNALNLRIYREIAGMIRAHGLIDGKTMFSRSETYAEVLKQSSDAARSLLGQFESPRAENAVCRLERLPADAPIQKLDELAGLAVPTLVLANRRDPVHPFEFGETLAQQIAGATFGALTPKSESVERHAADLRHHISTFLHHHFSSEV